MHGGRMLPRPVVFLQVKNVTPSWAQWLILVIRPAWETEIKRITVPSQPG
jgi:hypothetical protein